jgi:putative DNA primase/helicase
VTSFTQDGGTHARVLRLWGSPFGKADAALAGTVHALDQGVRAHYGHAGPRFVCFLLQKKGRWAAWRKSYRALQEAYARRAGDNPVAIRLASYFAALTLCARLAHRALDLPWAYRNPQKLNPVVALWDDQVSEAREADKAAQALAHVMGWAYAHQADFHEDVDTSRRQPPAGWAGKWDGADDGRWLYVGFFPDRLRQILEEGGYEFDPVLMTGLSR